jgi:hypothetical protein
MPWFEIIYSEEATSKTLSSDKVLARDVKEAAGVAMNGFVSAQSEHGAQHYRILDGQGMVVARGPKRGVI